MRWRCAAGPSLGGLQAAPVNPEIHDMSISFVRLRYEWRLNRSGSTGKGRNMDTSEWRKSSHSSNGGECVEVATSWAVLVRDTADRAGVLLSVPASAWAEFLASIR